MTVALSMPARNARVTALRDEIDIGAGTAQLKLYIGARPAAGGAPTIAAAVIDLPSPPGTVTDNVLNLDLPAEVSAIGSGDVSWARITNRNGDWVMDMDAGEAQTNDIVVSPGTVYAGGNLTILDNKIIE